MVDGNKIRRLREQKGLTIPAFVKEVYSSQTMISYVENGVKQPSVELLARIANYFGVAVDELLTDKERTG